MGDQFSFDIDAFVSSYVQSHDWFDAAGDSIVDDYNAASITTEAANVTSDDTTSHVPNASHTSPPDAHPPHPDVQPPCSTSHLGAPSSTMKPFCVGCGRTDTPLCKAIDIGSHQIFSGSLPHNGEYNQIRRHSAYDKKLVCIPKASSCFTARVFHACVLHCLSFSISGISAVIFVLPPLPGVQLLLDHKRPSCSPRLACTSCG